jgi:O-methyltransferase
MLAVARTLLEVGETSRDLYLFDTFETMPSPGPHDADVFGAHASGYYGAALADPGYSYLPEEQVRPHCGHRVSGGPCALREGYGGADDSRGGARADRLCRLDTEWYESTAHEMAHLYPRIAPRGVLIIDDYGHFLGARRAVDEYLEQRGIAVLLNRIDFTGRLILVPGT